MTLLELYEQAARQTEIGEGRFLALYAATLAELLSVYEREYVVVSPAVSLSGEITPDISDDAPCFEEYDASFICNILYLNDKTRTADRESSLMLREQAYRRVWKKRNRRAAAKPRAW